MAAVLSNHYASQPAAHYGYVGAPQPPPSPPMDEAKVSLPSISNLLGLADGGSPTTEQSPSREQEQQQQQGQQQQQQQQQQPQQQQQQQMQQQQQRQQQPQQPQQQVPMPQSRPDTRPNSSHYSSAALLRGAMPPTPPMGSEASFDGYNSPSTKSVSQLSVSSAPNNYYFEATPPPMGSVEPEHRHHPHHHMAAVPRVPVQATSYPQQAFAAPYMGQAAMPSYYPPPMQPTPPPQPQISGLYYQRPLPQSFPPLPVSVAPSPWQHHHYISPSSAATFPQSQDRYICQTCNKAFSRPSSLRIHSHSHTGEKPFKCPHPGCGKAFSVRSNMKRHERGCHNFETPSSGTALAS